MNHRPHICVQVGEGELVAEEKEKIVKELVQSKPALFLQRFGKFLRFISLFSACNKNTHQIGWIFGDSLKGWGDGGHFQSTTPPVQFSP